MSEDTPLLGTISSVFRTATAPPPSFLWSNISRLRGLTKALTFNVWLLNVILASPFFPGRSEYCMGSADVLNFTAGFLSLVNAQIVQPRVNVLSNKKLWGSFSSTLGNAIKRSVTQSAFLFKRKEEIVVVGDDLVDESTMSPFWGWFLNFFALTNLYAAVIEAYYSLCTSLPTEQRKLYRFACLHDSLMLLKRILTLATAVCSFVQMTNIPCLHPRFGAWLSFANILMTGINLYIVSDGCEWASRKQDAAAADL